MNWVSWCLMTRSEACCLPGMIWYAWWSRAGKGCFPGFFGLVGNLGMAGDYSGVPVGSGGGFVARLCALRDSAVKYRDGLGLRSEWEEAQLHYDGRNSGSSLASGSVGLGGDGVIGKGYRALHGGDGDEDGVLAPLFVGLTRAFADNAVTRVLDLAVPSNGRPWTLGSVLEPELGSLAEGVLPAAAEGGLVSEGGDAGDEGEALVQGGLAEVEDRRERARVAELAIAGWLERGDFRGEFAKAVRNAGVLGTGILCGPKVSVGGDVPVATSVLPWNAYPDPECGEDIQDGSHHWERGWMQRRELRGLLDLEDEDGDSLFDLGEVRACLREGPRLGGIGEDERRGGSPEVEGSRPPWGRHEVWYGYVDMDAEDYSRHCTKPGDGDGFGRGDIVSAEVQLVNDRLIRLSRSVLVRGGIGFRIRISGGVLRRILRMVVRFRGVVGFRV